MKEMNATSTLPAANQPRNTAISFISNGYDSHDIVEMYNTDDQDWVVLDPTFAMAIYRASDGHRATKEDIHNATVSATWSAINYVALGSFGYSLATSYYLDYPLLYLNLQPNSAGGAGLDPRPYMQTLAGLPSGARGLYVVSSDQAPLTVSIDGVQTTLAIGGPYSLSHAFGASTISLPNGSPAHVTAYQPNWYVFVH